MALTLEVKGHSLLYKGITYQSPRMSTTMFLKNHISVFSHNSINPNPSRNSRLWFQHQGKNYLGSNNNSNNLKKKPQGQW